MLGKRPPSEFRFSTLKTVNSPVPGWPPNPGQQPPNLGHLSAVTLARLGDKSPIREVASRRHSAPKQR